MCHDHCPQPISGGDALTELNLTIDLTEGTLPGFLVVPDATPAPSVLLLHDINGPNAFYRDLARRLADAGYVTLLPDLFHRHPPLEDTSREAIFARMQATEQAGLLDDIESALIWLKDHEMITGGLGLVGFCMGGTLAMLASARYPALDGTVAYYGFPNRERTPTAPIVPIDDSEVAGLQAPLLAFWGTGDAGVGMDNVDAYEAKLNQYHKDHEFVRYDGLPHGFLTFDEASPNFGGAADSWERTLAFFAARFGGAAPA
jgi:carboxymethylenebutenolidase